MSLFTQQNRQILQPFEPIIASALALDAWAQPLNKRRLQVEFRLHDEQQHVLWPQHSSGMTRADFLEKSTCFELFLQQVDHPNYVNVQITPRGLWNAYRFSQYRQPKQIPPLHEQHLTLEQLHIEHHRLALVLDLAKLYPRGSMIRLGLSALLAHPHALHSDWSLQHSGESADSHQAADWCLQFALLN